MLNRIKGDKSGEGVEMQLLLRGVFRDAVAKARKNGIWEKPTKEQISTREQVSFAAVPKRAGR